MAFWGPILAATPGWLLSKVAILCAERPPRILQINEALKGQDEKVTDQDPFSD